MRESVLKVRPVSLGALRWLLVGAVGAGCGDDTAWSPRDGSLPDAGAPTNSSVVLEVISAPSADLLSLEIAVHEAKLIGDRGEDLSPRVHDVGLLTVTPVAQAPIRFVNVPPATYSRGDLELHEEDGSARPSITLEMMRGPNVVAITTMIEVHVQHARCSEGVFVAPDSDARFVLSFDLESFRGVLEEITLPAPVARRIEVDDTSISGADMELIRERFDRAWSVECTLTLM